MTVAIQLFLQTSAIECHVHVPVSVLHGHNLQIQRKRFLGSKLLTWIPGICFAEFPKC